MLKKIGLLSLILLGLFSLSNTSKSTLVEEDETVCMSKDHSNEVRDGGENEPIFL